MLLALTLACSSAPAPAPAAAPAPPPPPPPVAAAPAPAATPAGTSWPLDSAASTVTASVHKLVGGHELAFPGVSGSVMMDAGKLTGVEVTLGIATLTTDSPKLQGHLLTEDFFAADRLPNATFKSTAVTGEAGALSVSGDLSIHGKTKALTFPVTLTVAENVASATAEIALNRQDFELVYPGKPDNLIQDAVELHVKLVAKGP